MNLFEQASRRKLRFTTSSGQISVEDLWDLPLQGKSLSLDSIAIQLHKQVSDETNMSFVTQKSTASADNQLRFDVVKHIIDVKLAERDARAESAARAEKRKQLTEALERRQAAALESKTEAELLAELKALDQ